MDNRVVSISCVCVGIGDGGTTPMLARIAIVDMLGQPVYAEYVKPVAPITTLRTDCTGILPANLTSSTAKSFSQVQREVSAILANKIVVGHKLWLCLSVLGIAHPALSTRDVALYLPFRNTLRQPNHLFELAELLQGLMLRSLSPIEEPIEYARAAMDLYRSAAKTWEASLASRTWPCPLPPDAYSRSYT
ncbi:hypothetical protein BKA62DRAFT_827873 [Auriculariales sp. MPI-PUGE-AT-0066]|nr:hypothetical protein BKA62DRAFT_827873 [Auriculariales sp. MPI-PUGE-AT-0066]